MDRITLSSAIEGYLLNAEARRLSQNTITGYKHIFTKLIRHFDADPIFRTLTSTQVKQFLVSQNTLSNKTLANHHAALSALWRWAAIEGLVEKNIIADIPQPKPEERIIEPYTQDEIKAMLKSLDKSASYSRPGKSECSNSLGTANRNRAIILTLLDTGMRASELCNLTIANADIKGRHVLVFGKGAKERLIPISAPVAQAIWRYLSNDRPKKPPPSDRLFTTPQGGPLDRHDLNHLIVRIAHRAGVDNADIHRFRHTFAITYLRNGGDVYTLQRILGHTTLDMVRRYLAIASVDIDAAHKIASPVANWRL